jgi:hypothetical protein
VADLRKKTLVLHIEVPGVWADDLDERAAEWGSDDPAAARLVVVTEELMRPEVGITLVSLPGEKEMSGDFEVHAYTGRIVGAETREADHG